MVDAVKFVKLSLLAVVLAAGCTDEEGRDTPGGGFKATCQITADCGCLSRTADDSYCRAEDTVQLQCLGSMSNSTCNLMCSSDTQCLSLFGASRSSTCSPFGYCQ